jgi:hypothetical protein
MVRYPSNHVAEDFKQQVGTFDQEARNAINVGPRRQGNPYLLQAPAQVRPQEQVWTKFGEATGEVMELTMSHLLSYVAAPEYVPSRLLADLLMNPESTRECPKQYLDPLEDGSGKYPRRHFAGAAWYERLRQDFGRGRPTYRAQENTDVIPAEPWSYQNPTGDAVGVGRAQRNCPDYTIRPKVEGHAIRRRSDLRFNRQRLDLLMVDSQKGLRAGTCHPVAPDTGDKLSWHYPRFTLVGQHQERMRARAPRPHGQLTTACHRR